MHVRVRRVYEAPSAEDGQRVLVDRLWPRGLSRDGARIDLWAKDIAPSHALRRWYGHEPEKWEEFRRRYFAELRGNPQALALFRSGLSEGTVTLLFGSKEPRLNNAHALAEFLATRADETASSL